MAARITPRPGCMCAAAAGGGSGAGAGALLAHPRRWPSAPRRFAPGRGDAHVIASSSPGGSAAGRPATGLILGIESSCDDTGVAVVTTSGRILGESLATQAEIHAAWGGVVPKLAQEAHEAAIDGCVEEALAAAGITADQLDAIAVTIGPGLSLCLRVGVLKARQLAAVHGLPLIPVHHMEAHALVARLGATPFAAAAAEEHAAQEEQAAQQGPAAAAASPGSTAGSGSGSAAPEAAGDATAPVAAAAVEFPFLCLLISGGHNLLLLVEGIGQYTQLGTTLDDALGKWYACLPAVRPLARLLRWLLDRLPARPPATQMHACAATGQPLAVPCPCPCHDLCLACHLALPAGPPARLPACPRFCLTCLLASPHLPVQARHTTRWPACWAWSSTPLAAQHWRRLRRRGTPLLSPSQFPCSGGPPATLVMLGSRQL